MFGNNNIYNNGFYPYNQQVGTGIMGGQQYPVNVGAAPPRAVSTLSPEDEQIIKNSVNKPLQVTELELAIAHCNHADPDKVSMVGISEDGYPVFYCSKCQSEFTVREYSKEGVKDLVRMIIDFIHTIKIGWINPPKEYAEQLYSIQALLEKLPQIFDKVQLDLDRMEKTLNNQFTAANGYNNGGNYYNMRSVPNWPLGGVQQPMMMQPQYNNYGYPQYQQVTPNYYQQNMAQQPMPMAGNPMVNQPSPFVQGGQVPNQQPIIQPQQQQPNVQPATTTVPPINNTTPRIPTPGTTTTTTKI